MRFRTTGLLLIIALGLGAYIFWVERPAQLRESVNRRYVLSLDPHRASYLRIETSNLVVECTKENADWYLVQPIRVRASYAGIQRILTHLAELPRGTVIAEADRRLRRQSLDVYGLDSPRATITVGSALQRSTITIGRDSPVRGYLYVRDVSTDEILTTTTNILSVLPTTITALRDRSLVQVPPEKVARLEIWTPNRTLILTRAGPGRWQIQHPVSGRASSSAILQWLDHLYHLMADDFVSDTPSDAAAYGFDPPAMKITVGAAEAESETILLIGETLRERPDWMYAKLQRSPTVYAIATNAWSWLALDLDTIRDYRPTMWRSDDVAGFELTSPEGTIAFIRKTNEWFMTQPRPWKADTDKLNSLLKLWLEGPAIGFLDNVTNLANLGFDRRAWELTAWQTAARDSTGVSVRLHIVTQTNRVLVKNEMEDPIYILPSNAFETLSVDPLFYRSPEILAVPSNAILAISVRTADGQQTLTRDDQGMLRPGAESQFVLDENAVKMLITALGDLRAKRFVAENPTDLTPFGLANPTAQITISLAPEWGLSKTLLLGHQAHSEVYAMLRGQELIFTLEPAVVSLLTQPLYRVPATRGKSPNP